MTQFSHLFTPVQIGKHTLPHRVVMGSMHLGHEEYPGGFEQMAAFYRERVLGGVNLIITGGISPNEAGVLSTGGATMQTPEDAANHKIVTDAVHDAGGMMILQLLHAGRYSKQENILSPSAIRAPINRIEPKEMTEEEILSTIEDYANAARRSVEAGYDGVEVMGSEGYLINTFLAPRTNKRTDRWGGDAAGRRLFALEVTKAVREAIGPDRILSFRISMTDLVPEGCTNEELLELAEELEKLQVDLFVTGIGWHESRVPTIATSVPRAAFTEFTAMLKKRVAVPVAATNRINTPETAEQVLASGEADLVAIARPFLADPAFVAKARDGEPDRINTCIACNQACLDHVLAGKLTSCLVNPRAGNETTLVLLPTRRKKTVAVVGGGVAGLAAAAAAGERGFNVTLFESRDSLGGQFDMAMRIPGKEEFKHTLRFYEGELQRYNVKINLGVQVGVTELQNFDEVIVATGVTPRIPDIEGVDLPNVLTYPQVIRGEKEAGKKVVILGAGGIGFDMAEFLTQAHEPVSLNKERFMESWGVISATDVPGNVSAPQREDNARQVTMLQRKATKAGSTLGLTTGWIHKAEVVRRGVETVVGATYNKITPDGLHATVDGEERFFPCDSVVLCTGQESVTTLYDELAAAGVKAHLIGGAKLAGELDAKRAIYEGVEVASVL